ncbi:MAG: hypothetical protein COS76_04550 [Candidatus Portnoybacteria bacterium CG06_land_8_20_14_3_00_39_12]|uniref:Ribosome recycling factor domain-containing protein n=3 Tax=Candidatus Portnoyibacteriota TaxID=1817913 RepID=A0A2M8KGF8_9BACT|nr:MAG: hypothetical protein AUJ33_03100 [Parcubacteria group bacterium CG1_02_40_25]PIU74739.1 MAG: hypothetical protein COS76_04550 [Candidatus Portnoybacteria bacterium CG06_land_8_20_14_3_00_39_12]PIZ70438.1 MAG: hypothetical protein COY09_03035 [Candidatus Portnoybacteria bacterium CG_4_10_14_0_2_um_filter_39_11]PJE59008.1 MAG: hypothetical protein COU83_00685 [Candidatus Portnoybacteria bacterium CG10_big_fil_rev_8_21_14_0_10_40_22]
MEPIKQIINNIKPNLERIVEFLRKEFMNFHAGQVSADAIGEIEVSCYGSLMPIIQLGTIRRPEGGVLVIEPWDKSILKDIQKAISITVSNLSVSSDGDVVRVSAPALTKENRQALIRELHQILEEARISIRGQRELAWKEIQDMERIKEITEDDKFRAKDELQKIIDQYNETVEGMGGLKEKEISG